MKNLIINGLNIFDYIFFSSFCLFCEYNRRLEYYIVYINYCKRYYIVLQLLALCFI